MLRSVLLYTMIALGWYRSFGTASAFVRSPFALARFDFSEKSFFNKPFHRSMGTGLVISDDHAKEALSDHVPIHKCEGLFAVEKPLDWTSNDVVCYIRGILEKDAKGRGANVVNARSRRNKSQKVKVGHGGTLDPLATGVLVIGVGKGTKELQG